MPLLPENSSKVSDGERLEMQAAIAALRSAAWDWSNNPADPVRVYLEERADRVLKELLNLSHRAKNADAQPTEE